MLDDETLLINKILYNMNQSDCSHKYSFADIKRSQKGYDKYSTNICCNLIESTKDNVCVFHKNQVYNCEYYEPLP